MTLICMVMLYSCDKNLIHLINVALKCYHCDHSMKLDTPRITSHGKSDVSERRDPFDHHLAWNRDCPKLKDFKGNNHYEERKTLLIRE